jgi:hypothetical protein
MYCHFPAFLVSFLSFSIPSEAQLRHICVLLFFFCSWYLSSRSLFLLKPNWDIYIYVLLFSFSSWCLSSLLSEAHLRHIYIHIYIYKALFGAGTYACPPPLNLKLNSFCWWHWKEGFFRMFERKNHENLTKTVCLAKVLVRASLSRCSRNCICEIHKSIFCNISGTNRDTDKTKYVLESSVHILVLITSIA